VRILELPGLGPKEDVIDWAKRGGSAVQLNQFIATARSPSPAKSATEGELESVTAASIEIEPIEWLWPNRLALGKLALLGGLPDRGKGLIISDMAARVTTGDVWPCAEGRALQGNVFFLSAEDDISDTIVPRLTAAGADLRPVHIVRMARQPDNSRRQFSLVTDLALLRRKVEEIGDVRLIVIDPLSAYLGVGKIDSYRTTDVRAVLSPLTDFAAEKHISVLGVLHFNKKADVTNAMLRISDSMAFVAAARHCFVVVDDPENERRLFLKAKNNLAPDTKGLSYGVNAVEVGAAKRTGAPIWAPRIAWGLEHVEITATEAMQAEAGGKSTVSGAKGSAEEFLHKMLANGPVAKSEIEEAADAECIALATLRRAKESLGVVSKKGGLRDGWTWELPQQKPLRGAGDE
jgi:putative DNA primase/helicase